MKGDITLKQIVLYGAGNRGEFIYRFLNSIGCGNAIYGFCDKRAEEIRSVHIDFHNGTQKLEDMKSVFLPEEVQDEDVLYYITPKNPDLREEIKRNIKGKKTIEFCELPVLLNLDGVKFERDFCAFSHLDYMDEYFDLAEECLDIFWDRQSPFLTMFSKLDLSDVIELACGRGRHVPQYIERARRITLVDILQKNIDICRERFQREQKINYYKNDGYDLKNLKSDSYSSLFTYDAMVHFELIDIYSYLGDIFRVLGRGGRALLHHSNNGSDYRASFASAPHSRSFMSKEVFAYLANRAGFTILDQKVIDWGDTPELDCITLIEKPQ